MGSVKDVPNGYIQPAASEEGGTYGVQESNGIPPPSAHANGSSMEEITIPLNDVPAFTPTKKLRVVTIGAGYSGLIFAHKLQHVYNEEMDVLIDHVIYEAKDQPGVSHDPWLSSRVAHPSTGHMGRQFIPRRAMRRTELYIRTPNYSGPLYRG